MCATVLYLTCTGFARRKSEQASTQIKDNSRAQTGDVRRPVRLLLRAHERHRRMTTLQAQAQTLCTGAHALHRRSCKENANSK
eukprot:5740293-Pleurochrysis_carterae.AAC.1